MIEKLVEIVLFILSIPFRYKCKRVGRSVRIAPGYSIFLCHLENVIIEDKVKIGLNTWIQTVPIDKISKPIIVIKENTSIGRNATISAAKKIIIGRNCLISYNVSVLDQNHGFEDVTMPPKFQGLDIPETIEIGDDCFIGAHSFILKGVVLGKHCIVGANSVVTKSFPPFSVVAGVPAKKIRNLQEVGIEANDNNDRQ